MAIRLAAASLVLLGTASLLATPASARLDTREGQGNSIVRVCGKTGHWECVSARVRTTSLGKQYLSPGGNWRSCRGDCREQLRRDTVDFWDYHRD